MFYSHAKKFEVHYTKVDNGECNMIYAQGCLYLSTMFLRISVQKINIVTEKRESKALEKNILSILGIEIEKHE